MAVALKRVSGAIGERIEEQKSLSRARANDTETDRPDPEELARIAAEQLVAEQERLLTLMKRFGRGAGKWGESDWQWEEPDWEAAPETWPRLAKLLWLFTNLHSQFSTWEFRTYLNSTPTWCPGCEPAPPSKGYAQGNCLEHNNYVAVVQRVAAKLGWREAVTG